VNWTLTKDITPKEWDKQLVNFSDYDFYQTYNWGQYKKYFGWKPYRFIAIDSNKNITGMAQCLLKSMPFSIGILWCPGGPTAHYKMLNKNFINSCYKAAGKRLLYIRIRPSNAKSVESFNYMINDNWKLPKNKITSSLSMLLDLKKDIETLKADLSKNWSRNLRRFKESELTISHCSKMEANELIPVYRNVEKFKGISAQYTDLELKKLFEYFNEKIVLFRCDNKDGKLIAFRGAIIVGDKAFDFFAATHSSGRKLYPSNKLLYTLLLHCKSLGVITYDLGGIDSVNNPGVYHFKKGTGANKHEILGEWEWANSNLLRMALNLVIKVKLA